MKPSNFRTLVGILCALALISTDWWAQAGMLNVVGGGTTSAPVTCTTVHAENTSAHTINLNFHDTADTFYAGQWGYDPGSNISVCAVESILTKTTGSITALTYYCAIYTMSGNDLATLQGTSTGIAGNDSWSQTSVKFEFSSAVALSSGTSYAIVFYHGGSVSATDRAAISLSAAGGLGGYYGVWNSSKVRTNWGTDDTRLKVYK